MGSLCVLRFWQGSWIKAWKLDSLLPPSNVPKNNEMILVGVPKKNVRSNKNSGGYPCWENK